MPVARAHLRALEALKKIGVELDEVETQLVAGMVDLNRPIAPAAELSMNQKLAGFEAADSLAVSAPVGQVDIQHTYDIGLLTADPGDTIYSQIVGQELPARRLHVWNAQTDQQVTVIYKVKNESDQPFGFYCIVDRHRDRPMAPDTDHAPPADR